MEKQIKSDMEKSYNSWSKVLLNDTKQLVKKNSTKKYSRRLFSKVKNSPSRFKKSIIKMHCFEKKTSKTKITSSDRMKNAKKSKCANEWLKEYDVWNMIVQALDHSLTTNHKVNWSNKEIGIRDSDAKIRLLQNREELNRQILVCSNDAQIYLKDLISSDDSTDDFSIKIKFKLVPIVEGITLINNSVETSYKFAENVQIDANNNDANTNDAKKNQGNKNDAKKNEGNKIDANNNDLNYVNMEMEESNIDMDDDITLTNSDKSESSIETSFWDRTMTNSTCSTWEYSDFCMDVLPEASSTFISDDKENIPCVIHDKENIPLLAAPKKKFLMDSRTFNESPLPKFAKKDNHLQVINDFRVDEIDSFNVSAALEYCKNIRNTLDQLEYKLNVIENKCYSILAERSGLMSGINFLNDSLELLK